MRLRVGSLAATVCLAAVACDTPTAPAFPADEPPTAFAMSVGGFGFGSHDVTLRNDTLVVVRRPDFAPNGATTTYVVPARDAWHTFWRAADAAGVREWPSHCVNPNVVDGGGFTLDIAYRGGHVASTGANSYPRRGGRCNGDPERTPEYSAFLAAVAQLIGRAYP